VDGGLFVSELNVTFSVPYFLCPSFLTDVFLSSHRVKRSKNSIRSRGAPDSSVPLFYSPSLFAHNIIFRGWTRRDEVDFPTFRSPSKPFISSVYTLLHDSRTERIVPMLADPGSVRR